MKAIFTGTEQDLIKLGLRSLIMIIQKNKT